MKNKAVLFIILYLSIGNKALSKKNWQNILVHLTTDTPGKVSTVIKADRKTAISPFFCERRQNKRADGVSKLNNCLQYKTIVLRRPSCHCYFWNADAINKEYLNKGSRSSNSWKLIRLKGNLRALWPFSEFAYRIIKWSASVSVYKKICNVFTKMKSFRNNGLANIYLLFFIFTINVC